MGKKETIDFDVDDGLDMVELPKPEEVKKPERTKPQEQIRQAVEEPVNCLRKEKVIARFIPQPNGIWGDNPKHILRGGMAEDATLTLVVPRMRSGVFVNVLTNDEKACLERAMNMEFNALSVHAKDRNFWDDSNDEGINKVILRKQDNYFDLSIPEDYIKYKILLANKDIVAPSLQSLQDIPKATYRYVLISDSESTKQIKKNVSMNLECYKAFAKVETDVDVLRYLVETIEGHPVVANEKIEVLQGKVDSLIQRDSRRFHAVITDKLRDHKVLIKKCVEKGIIAKRGNYYYIRSNNKPLCFNGQDPTLSAAAEYIANIGNQELYFALQKEIKN